MKYIFIHLRVMVFIVCYVIKAFTPSNIHFPSFAYTHLINEQNIIDKVFFAPRDAETIEAVLVGLIQSTQTSISGALFRLSNKRIIQELIAAHKRGVIIDVILDPSALSASQEISKLSHAGIPLSLCTLRYGILMHHKFLIFKDTLACPENNLTPIPAVVATGSLNLTEHGFSNRENINFRDNVQIVNAFIQENTALKAETDRYVLTRKKSSKAGEYLKKFIPYILALKRFLH